MGDLVHGLGLLFAVLGHAQRSRGAVQNRRIKALPLISTKHGACALPRKDHMTP